MKLTAPLALALWASACGPGVVPISSLDLSAECSPAFLSGNISACGGLSLAETVSLLAGSGAPSFADGIGAAAAFNQPAQMATDGTFLYLADMSNHRIRRVRLATGQVTTIAGTGSPAYTDAVGTAAAFTNPAGLTLHEGYLYIGDVGNNRIRRMHLGSGQVITFSGSGAGGDTPGPAGSAQFGTLGAFVVADGALYITDVTNHRVKQVSLVDGSVTHFAGNGTPGFLNATGTSALFNSPTGLATDGTYLYVSDSSGNRIRRVTLSNAAVTTLAGSGAAGAADGAANIAQFTQPEGLATDGVSLYVAEIALDVVRKVSLANGYTTTFSLGLTDPYGVVTDGVDLFVCERSSHTLVRVR
ncbi:MAG: hypothetical protein IT285_04395 [Bdellovibrionales bacterium]|nr:hypothetical protein [Bdellovibrionales bacterium]